MNIQSIYEIEFLSFQQFPTIGGHMDDISSNLFYSMDFLSLSDELLLNSVFDFSHTYEIEDHSQTPDALLPEKEIICSAITAVVTAFEDFVQQLADAIVNFGKKMVGAFETAINAVKDAVEKVVEVIGEIIDWIKEQIFSGIEHLKNVAEDMKESAYNAYSAFILAVFNNNTVNAAIELAKMVVFWTSFAGFLYGITVALAIAIGANLLLGTIISALVTTIFSMIFYSLYPEEYRKVGESIISAGDLILMPADKLYEFDKQHTANFGGWFLTALVATIGVGWTGVVESSPLKIFLTWAMAIITLFAMIPLVTSQNASFTNKVIATGLLGIASYGLVSTTTMGWEYVVGAPGIGSKVVRGMFYLLFTTIGAYSVLTLIGYLHKG